MDPSFALDNNHPSNVASFLAVVAVVAGVAGVAGVAVVAGVGVGGGGDVVIGYKQRKCYQRPVTHENPVIYC